MRFPWSRQFACANIIPQRPAHHTKPVLLSLKDVFLWIINNNGNLNNNSFYMLNTCYVPWPLLSTLYTLPHLILRKQESAVNAGAQGHWTCKYSCPHSLLEDMPWLLGLLDLWSPRGRSGQSPSEQATQDRPEWLIYCNHSCGTRRKTSSPLPGDIPWPDGEDQEWKDRKDSSRASN